MDIPVELSAMKLYAIRFADDNHNRGYFSTFFKENAIRTRPSSRLHVAKAYKSL